MPGFAHFLPGLSAADVASKRHVQLAVLAGHGLERTLLDCTRHPDDLVVVDTVGPDNLSGVILWPVPPHGGLPKRHGYDPAVQTWRPVRNSGDELDSRPCRYTGWITAEPPHPTDLERRTRLSGWQILDEHQEQWLVPVARSIASPRGSLPWEISWDEYDHWQIGVDGRYADFWRRSAHLDDLIRQHGREEYSGHMVLDEALPDAELQFALRMIEDALQLNYRVDRHVLAAYQQARPGWMTAAVASLMVNAIVDMLGKQLYDAAKKKTVTPPVPGGMSSGLGSPDETPSTAQAEANC